MLCADQETTRTFVLMPLEVWEVVSARRRSGWPISGFVMALGLNALFL